MPPAVAANRKPGNQAIRGHSTVGEKEEASGGCEPRRDETRLSWTGTVQNASWGQEPGERTSRKLR